MPAEAVDFELIFEALLAPHLALAPDFTILAANAGLCRLLQRGRDELLGQPVLSIFEQLHLPPPATAADWPAALEQILTRHHTLTLAHHAERSPGTALPRHWQIQLRPVLDAAGTVRYILCRLLDVTDLVVAEQQSSVSQEGFGLLAQATHDAIWDSDPRTAVVWRNDKYASLFGYPADAASQAPRFWHERVHPDDLPAIEAEQQRALASTDSVVSTEYRFRRADGGWAEVVDRAYIVRDADGQAVRLLGAMQDVTRQRTAERLAQQNAARFQQLAEVQHQLIWMTDAAGGLEYVNPYWEQYTGLSLAESRDWGWQQLAHPHDFEQVKRQRQAALGQPQPVEMEIRLREQTSGQYRWFLSRSVPVQAADGTIVQWVGTATDIDERKRTEQALRQSNERFSRLLEVLPQMAWISRPEGGVTYYNQRWYDFTGGTFEELQEWGWEKFIHPDDLPATLQGWQHAVATGTLFEAEHRWRDRQGRYRWFLARAEAIRDTDGTILQWVGTNTDIHERRQTLALLQEKDQQLQRIIGNMPAYICTMFGPQHIIGFANAQIQRLLGGRAKVGLPVAEALPEVADNGLIPLLDEVYATGQPYSALEIAMPVIGEPTQPVETRYFDFTYQPLCDEAGQTHGILMFAVDATERVQARQRAEQLAADVRHREEQFRFLTESMPQIAWTADARGQVEYINQRWSDYTGLGLDNLMQADWAQLITPADLADLRLRYLTSMASGQDFEQEAQLRGRDGQYRWFLHRARPMRDAAGQVLKWFGTSTDINDFKRSQQRLEQQNEALTLTNQDLDSFVYTASHDLKQPIDNMAGIFEELTRTAYFRDPEAVKLIAMFERALQQIYDTIHNLSELVQVQKLRLHQPTQAVALEPLAREVLASIGEQLHLARARVTTDFTAAPVVTFVRPNLQSILYNLISNALKYAAPGRPPRIGVRSREQDGQYVLEVQDNGLGIDLERYGSQLFVMFRRFHPQVEGSGMGLYLVNRIVQSQGGRVEVESVVGEGTTFRLYFPTNPPESAETLAYPG